MQGLKDMTSGRSVIGIKRMGELDNQPFRENCKKKYVDLDADIKFAELTSKWEEQLADPNWYPCKVVSVNGKEQVRKLTCLFKFLNFKTSINQSFCTGSLCIMCY